MVRYSHQTQDGGCIDKHKIWKIKSGLPEAGYFLTIFGGKRFTMIHIYRKVPSKISTIMVAFDAGSRAEGDKYTLGLAHMLEHMVFKGTPTRHYLDIPREIGFLGGDVNAFTSQEFVCFYVSVPFENTEKAMDILSDIIFNSTFPEEEFVKEREVVKEEELSSQDNVENFIWDKFCEEFFTHRLALPVIGTQESIAEFTTKELKQFHKKFYKRSGAIVSFCSNHSKREGKKLLNKYFGKASGTMKHEVELHEPVYKDSRKIILTRPQLEHNYVWLCYPGTPIGEPGEAAEDMLLSIFGQGMDSRLFTEVREKKGLCYGISAFNVGHRDSGATLITSSTREENVEDMLALVEEEIEKIKTELVSDEELERARNKYRASCYAITERSSSLARTGLTRTFFGLSSQEELEEEANKVSTEDIRRVAQKMFDDTKKLVLICKAEGEIENVATDHG